jgi:hypothetical protein
VLLEPLLKSRSKSPALLSARSSSTRARTLAPPLMRASPSEQMLLLVQPASMLALRLLSM